MTASLCFNDFTFSPVTRDNQPWFKSSEIARALGYAREDTLSRLYDRNADEFTENMTQVVENLDTVNLTVRVRHLLPSRLPPSCHVRPHARS